MYVVVATGNHFILDAVGGVVVFGAGYGVARFVTKAGRGRPLSERDDDHHDELVGQSDLVPYRAIAAR